MENNSLTKSYKETSYCICKVAKYPLFWGFSLTNQGKNTINIIVSTKCTDYKRVSIGGVRKSPNLQISKSSNLQISIHNFISSILLFLLNLILSTHPEMPATEPHSVYCHMV